MFGRKKDPPEVVHVTRIELSDETRQLLVGLDNDLQAVRELVGDVLDNSTRILHALTQEILAQVPGVPEDAVGVQVFAGEEPNDRGAWEQDKRAPRTRAMAHDDPDRRRSGPFTRTPRHKQVEWLRTEILADGEWHTPIEVARNSAGDEREFRYLRGAVSGRLREMHEEGLVERRDSDIRGSMYEYRLKP